jgi:chromate reductase, NAD(P)H dehydrogenase (quinone)
MLVLCATNRPGANSRIIAKRVCSILKDNGCDTLVYLDLADLKPDIFKPTVYAEKPEWFVKEFQQPVLDAPGMVVVVPEYNGSFPGVMKYFIDMLKFPESLVEMPVMFIGCAAGQWGALRSVEQLTHIFQYRNAHIFGQRLFIPKVHEAITPDGQLGDYEERLKRQISAFQSFVWSLPISKNLRLFRPA